ncbi:hypothetical protein DNTS_012213, partial [Danionella cerebrum]
MNGCGKEGKAFQQNDSYMWDRVSPADSSGDFSLSPQNRDNNLHQLRLNAPIENFSHIES